jgi:hypothetical protein
LTGGIVAPVVGGLADPFMAAYSHSLGVVVSQLTHLGRAPRMHSPRWGLVAPTSRAAAPFYGRLFEIAPACAKSSPSVRSAVMPSR